MNALLGWFIKSISQVLLGLFSEILDRAHSSRTLIQRLLSQKDIASSCAAGSFQLPVAQDVLLQQCAELLADAAIEELRNLPR